MRGGNEHEYGSYYRYCCRCRCPCRRHYRHGYQKTQKIVVSIRILREEGMSMSTGAIIAIVAVAVVLIVITAVVIRKRKK